MVKVPTLITGGIVLITSIIRRCRQLYSALSSKITEEDRALVNIYLDVREQGLFYGMDEKVQKHCINVALTVINNLAHIENEEKTLLIKGAFLHDIGKLKDTFNLMDRILYVLGKKFMPQLTTSLADNSSKKIMSRFRKAIYFNLHHPIIGAQMAKTLGLDSTVIFFIENHHDKSLISTNQDLRLLAEADEKN